MKNLTLTKFKLHHVSAASLLFIMNMPHAISADAPGVIAQEPLQTSTTAEPNIMFILDDSGSMETIVAETPYVASFTYDADPDNTPVTACSSPVATSTEVRLHLTGASYDTPKITLETDAHGTDYDLGNDAGEVCFDPTGDYEANLYTNAIGVRTGVAAPRAYKGNYLNWYFDPNSTSGTWVQKKPGTNTRLEVAQTSLSTLINGLSNVRVGLALFDGSNGADFKVDMGDIATVKGDTSTAGTLLYEIDNSSPGGRTPLVESLHDVGRYFSEDYCNSGSSADLLTLHPGGLSGTETTKDCNTVFHGSGLNQSGTAPIQFFCQRNFAILMTDGDSKDDQGINSSSGLWDYDGDCSGTNASNCITGSPNYDKKIAPAAYFPSGSDYLDDVAQAMFEIDLRPDLDDSNGNEVTNNVATYTIGFSAESVVNNTLLEDTANQAGGEFIQADDSAQLASAFKRATNSIIEQTSTSSAVTFNSSTLSSQSAVYQALYNTARWSGELNSLPINGITGAIETGCTQGTNNCWKAAEQLDLQTISDHGANRFIIVAGDNNLKHGVEFKYTHGTNDYTGLISSSDIPQALVADLCSSAAGTVSGTSFPCSTADVATKAANGAYIEDLVNYLRGDNRNEGSTSTRNFRVRSNDLGDIVNSSPVFIGEPQQNWPNGDGSNDFPILSSVIPSSDYKTWKASSVNTRPEVVYVASNDGMLHGFRAKDKKTSDTEEDVNISAGQEVFAFIPSGTFSTNNTNGLHYLANKAYTHRYYNDLSPTISDVYMDYRNDDGTPTWSNTGGSGSYSLATKAKDTPTAEWRTVLLGGQGAGGKSLYLLDVTDPKEYTDTAKQNAEKLVLWEFAHNDLGYTFSKPTIAMMNNGKFAAIFGNGYNSTSCEAKLFIVFLEGGLDGVWTQNTDYFIYGTGAGSTTAGDCSGMSTPAVVDIDRNGTADRVYAGDLKGNLWAFDLCTLTSGSCSATASDWSIADVTPLMYAEGLSNIRIPITSKPIVSRDPASSDFDDLIIIFGTGQYLADTDKSSTGLQRMYGILDPDAFSNTKANWNRDGGQTSPDKWADTVLGIDASGARVFTSTEGIGSNDWGWRINLNDPSNRERMVVNPKIRNNILFFNTLIPDDTTCSYGGSGWIMSVNVANGGLPPRAIFDVNGDGIIDGADIINGDFPAGQKLNEIPAESTFLGDNQYTPGSDGTINVRKVDVGSSRKEGRMSWKELYEEQ